MTPLKKRLVGNTTVKLNFHPWGSFCKKKTWFPACKMIQIFYLQSIEPWANLQAAGLKQTFFWGMTNIKVGKNISEFKYCFQPSETKQLEVQVWWNFLLTKLRCKICTSSCRKVIFVLPTNKRDTTQPHETFLSILVNHGGILWVISLYNLFFLNISRFF